MLQNAVSRGRRAFVHDHLTPIIRLAPVSSIRKPGDMREVANEVCMHMQAIGVANARVICHGNVYPVVFGEIKSDFENAPTIIIGGHYDAQPSTPSRWTVTRPHTPRIVTQGGDTRIFGRGTSDDWGQVLTHLAAVKIMRQRNLPCPVNLKFVIEGGEEEGSPGMDGFIRHYKQLLQADLVIITDSAPGRDSVPVITTRARGIVSAVVELKLGTNDPHSGDNLTCGVMEVLSAILSLKDLKTMRVRIPNFYDDVVLPDSERRVLDAMPFDTALYQEQYGLKRLYLLEGHSPQVTMWGMPSYEWHTVVSDHCGGRSMPIPFADKITTYAKAYVGMRIVPNQNPQRIFDLFKTEVYRRLSLLTGVPAECLNITCDTMALPFVTDTSGPIFEIISGSMAQAFNVHKTDLGGCGGTEPVAIFWQQILGVPVVFNAYNSPRDNFHGDDESFSLNHGFEPGVVANILMYQRLYELRQKQT